MSVEDLQRGFISEVQSGEEREKEGGEKEEEDGKGYRKVAIVGHASKTESSGC